MIFRSRRYRRIRLRIHPRAGFRRILEILNEVVLPETVYKADHIKYALLEMINNSLRAHRERRLDEPIEVDMELSAPDLRIHVRDRGPGFDPRALPFALEGDPAVIDLDSDGFQDYRRRHNYRRFGMGLPLVKRTFDSFRLSFFDEAGREIPWDRWDPQHVKGTAITVTKRLAATPERAGLGRREEG